MHLTGIHIYPVKSLAGISLTEAVVERRGLQYDRRWMLVDDAGRFVSQREQPRMAWLVTAIEPPHLVVFEKNNPASRIAMPLDWGEGVEGVFPKKMVEVWSARCAARALPAEFGEWFSDILGQRLHLVRMPLTTRRAADDRYAPKGQVVSFADGFPYLLIGQSSLDDLNTRLAQPVGMERFRPNLVFAGGQPFEEDGWSDFTIGSVPFRAAKPCARCIMVTNDPATARLGAEPLRTLATYRQQQHKVLFGQNVVWMGADEPAMLRVGDSLRPG